MEALLAGHSKNGPVPTKTFPFESMHLTQAAKPGSLSMILDQSYSEGSPESENEASHNYDHADLHGIPYPASESATSAQQDTPPSSFIGSAAVSGRKRPRHRGNRAPRVEDEEEEADDSGDDISSRYPAWSAYQSADGNGLQELVEALESASPLQTASPAEIDLAPPHARKSRVAHSTTGSHSCVYIENSMGSIYFCDPFDLGAMWHTCASPPDDAINISDLITFTGSFLSAVFHLLL
jgi:hypothetical protein